MPNSKSAYSEPSKISRSQRHIIVVWVDNAAGVLARVIGLFSGRGYNIESLAVAEVDRKQHMSRITIVSMGTPEVIQQIRSQLSKQLCVHKVAVFKRDDENILFRELALFKIKSSKKNQEKVKKACKKYNSVILDKSKNSFVIQVTALRREIDKLVQTIRPYGLISISRTGAVAMTRGPEVFK